MRIKCKKCGQELDCKINHHVMETCMCKATSVDVEDGYCRLIGAWEMITNV